MGKVLAYGHSANFDASEVMRVVRALANRVAMALGQDS